MVSLGGTLNIQPIFILTITMLLFQYINIIFYGVFRLLLFLSLEILQHFCITAKVKLPQFNINRLGCFTIKLNK